MMISLDEAFLNVQFLRMKYSQLIDTIIAFVYNKMFKITLFVSIITSMLVRQGCSNCPTMQYFDPNTSLCQNCSSSCNLCTNRTACTACQSGYILTNFSNCQKCPSSNCKTCTSSACTTCLEGFVMSNQSCSQSDDILSKVMMIGGICLGVLIFVNAICVISFCVRKYLERQPLARVANSMSQGAIQMEPPSFQQIVFDEVRDESDRSNRKEEDPCPFCLDPELNLEIPCSHLYHINCLSLWLTKHNDCPICRRIVTGNSKLYCSKCLRYYISFSSSMISSQRINRKWVCQKCKQPKKQQTKIDLKQQQ